MMSSTNTSLVSNNKPTSMLSSVLLGVLLLVVGGGGTFITPTSAFVRSTVISTAFLGGSNVGINDESNSRSSSSSSSTQTNLFGFLDEGKKALVKSMAGEYDQSAIKARMDGLIADNKAKGVLDSLGAKYTVVELDTDPDGKAIRAEMADLIGRTSVPAIWIDSTFIGGCNDGPMGGVVSLNQSGKLTGMLQSAGAL